MSKLSTRPVFTNPTIQDTDEVWINVDNLDGTFTSQKMTIAQHRDLINATPFFADDYTTDAGNNKNLLAYRSGSIMASNFNTRKSLTSSGASDNNKWWKVFECLVTNDFDSDSFKVQMNELNELTGQGKSIFFDVILKRQDPYIYVNVNVESGLSSFDLANFDVLYNSTTKKLSFYYRVIPTYTFTNWLILNAKVVNISQMVWSNTLIGASLSGETSDPFTTKTITLNKINGVYTLPSTAPTAGQVLGYSSSGVSDWVNPSSAIPQTNKIYVDSVNGINATTGRGNINTPYLTPEYALSNTTNTGTVTATTTSTSATLTAVSDTTSIVIGQYITGTGIPYGSTVVSKTVNTIVLSQVCTASATVTATWWTIYELNLNGNFVATSNWFKAGFFIDAGSANISFGAFTLFAKTSSILVDESITGGNWYGTSASSKFITQSAGSNNDLYVNINNYYSIGTGIQLDLYQYGSVHRNIYFKCKTFDARFGSCGYFYVTKRIFVEGDFYGLLYGLYTRTSDTININGTIETPSSITAFETYAGKLLVNANIIGQISLTNAQGVFSGLVNGTTHTINASQYQKSFVFNGHITCTTLNLSGDGNINFNCAIDCATTNNTGLNIKVEIFRGNYIGSGVSKSILSSMQIPGNTTPFRNITLTNTAEVTIVNNPLQDGAIVYGQYPSISIASGCKITVLGFSYGAFTLLDGTFVNRGTFNLITRGAGTGLMSAIVGTLENNGTIELVRYGVEGALNTPCLVVGTGSYIQNGGKLFCSHADSKSGLIRKTANGGVVVLKGQPNLKASNGLAPLQILSNTGTAQNVLNFGVITNGAVGFRLADTFTDTTYGTAYAPNILVGGINYEDTTYNF